MLESVKQVYAIFNGPAGAASMAVALIALTGVMAGALVTYLNAARTVYITSITVERSKWIDKLRINIAGASGALLEAALKMKLRRDREVTNSRVTLDEIEKAVSKSNEYIALVQLQLNPFGAIDRNLLKLLEGFDLQEDTAWEAVLDYDKAVIAHSQWLLKIEWEKVKYEARGWLYRLFHVGWERRRLGEYRAWVDSGESPEEIIARVKDSCEPE
jgi:low affinity Fe/Cu permease